MNVNEMYVNENNNENKINNNNINDDAMFLSDEYKRITHNINNEGKYTVYIVEEVHDDHTVPIIYTLEEDSAIMKEFNETM